MSEQLGVANHELQRLVNVDGLTGIANRRHFDATLAREWRRAARNGSQLALIMADVDHFKKYNDHFGHQDGDDCLRQVANALACALSRPADLAARYGGEEFVVVLPETPASGALHVAERLRAAVSDLALPHPDSSAATHVTLSLGLAMASPSMSGSDELVLAADRAVYHAKRGGRNRVSVNSMPLPASARHAA